jgi:hypothetical protein
MDIDPKTYPSRNFARFMAHNQLIADATGQPIMASVQRLGGKTYVQKAIPDGETPSITNTPGNPSFGLNLGMSINPVGRNTPPQDGHSDLQPSIPPDQCAGIAPEEANQGPGIDEALFEEVVKTTLNPQRFPDLYRSCGTQKAAMEVETAVAAEIVAAYRRIKQNQDCPIVQGLNKLL